MIIGVDPGLQGAMGYIVNDIRGVSDIPTTYRKMSNGSDRKIIDDQMVANMMANAARNADRLIDTNRVMIIEDVHGMPGQSGPAAFTFGYGVGIITGIALAHGFRVERVHPARWKAVLGLKADKDEARAMAQELWPELAHLFTRKKDDGRAEAMLITYYGQQVFG